MPEIPIVFRSLSDQRLFLGILLLDRFKSTSHAVLRTVRLLVTPAQGQQANTEDRHGDEQRH